MNKKSFLKIGHLSVIISLCLIPASYLYAATTTEVDAEGYAIIIEGRKDIARESALNNAFRRAVEQAIGVMVEAESMVKNFTLLNDNVYSKSSGYIKNYKITDEKIEGDTFRIKITASVSTKKLMKDLDDIGLLIKSVGKPRMLMLISEQNILGDKALRWWGGGDSIGTGVVENTLMQKFMEKGFNFVDRQVILRSIKDDPALVNPGNDLSNELVLRLAAEGEAEVVIIGQAVAKAGPALAGTGMRSCQANISVRVENADNGETIAAFSTNAVAAHVDIITGGTEALKKASVEMYEKLCRQIVSNWKKRVAGTRSIKLVISGISFEKLKGFNDFLKEVIEDVEDVYYRSYKDDVAKFEIDVKAGAKEIAEELGNKEFEGGLLEIASFTSNVINLRFKIIDH